MVQPETVSWKYRGTHATKNLMTVEPRAIRRKMGMIKTGSRAKGRAGVDAVVRAARTSSSPHTVAGDSLSNEQASLACFAGFASSTANNH